MPGMRALVMYPMNALVEDQLVRLRRALDGPTQLAWLDHTATGIGSASAVTQVRRRTQEANLRRVYTDIARRADAAAARDRIAAAREQREQLPDGSLRRYRPYVPAHRGCRAARAARK